MQLIGICYSIFFINFRPTAAQLLNSPIFNKYSTTKDYHNVNSLPAFISSWSHPFADAISPQTSTFEEPRTHRFAENNSNDSFVSSHSDLTIGFIFKLNNTYF